MTKTGIFATPEQVKELKQPETPLVMLQCGMPRSRQEKAHAYALEQGLPEIEGFYGIDLGTGEFVSA